MPDLAVEVERVVGEESAAREFIAAPDLEGPARAKHMDMLFRDAASSHARPANS